MPTSLIVPIQLAFLPTAVAILIVFGVECALYFLKTPFYFRMGPALAREQWQTNVTRDEAWAALRAALPQCRFSVRDGGDIVCIRRAWWAWSAFPRATLRVAEEANSTVLIFEVKPFLSMAPFAVLFFLLMVAGVAALGSLLVVLSVCLTYWLLWRAELRKFGRLACVRKQLRPIGVLICSACGYDLFGREEQQPCPECGATPGLCV